MSRVAPERASVNFGPALRALVARHNGGVSESAGSARSLASWPCQSICVWEPTGEVEVVDSGPHPAVVFECRGCGSEWLRSEAWTPIDADGMVPPAVAEEAGQRRA